MSWDVAVRWFIKNVKIKSYVHKISWSNASDKVVNSFSVGTGRLVCRIHLVSGRCANLHNSKLFTSVRLGHDGSILNGKLRCWQLSTSQLIYYRWECLVLNHVFFRKGGRLEDESRRRTFFPLFTTDRLRRRRFSTVFVWWTSDD